MKEIIQHPTYGEIVYTESFWTSKKAVTVNGQPLEAAAKNEFIFGEKRAIIKGSSFTGVSMVVGDEAIELSPKPRWYEIILAILPLIFLLIWGNNATLCAIFPVVGGAIGGALGGAASVLSLFLMKKAKSALYKVLIGIGIFAAAVFVAFAFIMVLAFALVFAQLGAGY